jgi:preprotein translocase subunit SecF
VSVIIILAGIVSMIAKGGPKYGVDFLGGTVIQTHFPSAPDLGQVRDAVAAAGFSDAEIKTFGERNDVLIRVQEQESGTATSDAIMSALRQRFPDVVAAFLTIVGFSLNDTIVVMDRIRENRRLLRGASIENLINLSINQTLNRTILTSLTVMVVVLVLFFFGGEVIHSFAFAMVVGVIAGSYSTIYIAAPVVVEWEKRRVLKVSRAKA